MVWDIEEEERGTKEPAKHPKFTSSFHESGPHKGHFISAFISERNTVQVPQTVLDFMSKISRKCVHLCVILLGLPRLQKTFRNYTI